MQLGLSRRRKDVVKSMGELGNSRSASSQPTDGGSDGADADEAEGCKCGDRVVVWCCWQMPLCDAGHCCRVADRASRSAALRPRRCTHRQDMFRLFRALQGRRQCRWQESPQVHRLSSYVVLLKGKSSPIADRFAPYRLMCCPRRARRRNGRCTIRRNASTSNSSQERRLQFSSVLSCGLSIYIPEMK